MISDLSHLAADAIPGLFFRNGNAPTLTDYTRRQCRADSAVLYLGARISNLLDQSDY